MDNNNQNDEQIIQNDVGNDETEIPNQELIEKASKAFPSANKECDDNKDKKIRSDSNNGASTDIDGRSYDLTKHIHSYLSHYISLADGKAAFIFTLSSTLLGYLHSKKYTVKWLMSPCEWGFTETVIFILVLSLLLTILFSVAVVVPRLRGASKGLIYWKGITKFSKKDEYIESIEKLNDESSLKQLAAHTFELGHVCDRKYKLLRWSIFSGCVAIAALSVLFGFGL